MAKISYQLALTVPNGPKFAVQQRIAGETYSVSDVTVPPKVNGTAGTKVIDLDQDRAQIGLMLITTTPDGYSKEVALRFSDGADDADARTYDLSVPFLLWGNNVALRLLPSSVRTLTLENAMSREVKVDILIVRPAL